MLSLAVCLLAAAQSGTSLPPTDPIDPPAELVVPPLATLSLGPCEGGLGTEAALDGGALVATCRLRAPAAGDHWLAVLTRDAAGQASAVKFVRIRVDGDAPELSLSIEPSPVGVPDGRRFVAPRARLRATACDPLAGVGRLFVAAPDEVEGASQEERLVELPSQGRVEVRAWAVDKVGNRSAERRDTLAVDAEPPRGSIQLLGARSGDAGRIVVGPQTRASVEVSDADSGVAGWQGILDGSETPEAGWSGPWDRGPHRLEASAQDRVGNRASLPALELLVDDSPPEIQWAIQDPPFSCDDGSAFSTPTSLAVQATDPDAGVESLEWSADGAAWASVTPTLVVSGDAVRLRSRDRVGNQSETEARWTIDPEPPILSLRGPDNRPFPPGAPLSIALGEELAPSADDRCGVTALSAALGDGPWGDAPTRIRFESAGSFRVQLEAIDPLGNRARGEWTVDVAGGGP